MRMAGIRDIRAHTADLLGGDGPLLVTRHGRISGLYLPLAEPDRLPQDLRRELAATLGHHLSQLLEAQGIGEDEILSDFDAERRRTRDRRRRR
jgi:hypothetical protein